MTNKEKQLIETIKKDLTDTELSVFYKQNGIIFEYVDIFRDLAISLVNIVSSTYLGDSITDPSKQLKHFQWCWQKVLKNFATEHIYFKPKGSLYTFFAKYFQTRYYMKDDKLLEVEIMLQYWRFIMNYTTIKNHQQLNLFITTYKIMRQNLFFK